MPYVRPSLAPLWSDAYKMLIIIPTVNRSSNGLSSGVLGVRM